jgi:hypothetical protein
MYFHFIFILEAILGVDLDLSTLYHGHFTFLGCYERKSARVSSYKRLVLPSCKS